MRLVCLSDTHDQQISVPDGDVLIHAGDISCLGTVEEVRRGLSWLSGLPHAWKLFVAGNHDLLFEDDRAVAQTLLAKSDVMYLEDDLLEIDGVRFYGSPWQPKYVGAFNLPRGEVIAEKWACIPENLDVLITHGPPGGILDVNSIGEKCGCHDLLRRVETLKPKVHIFGHIHPSHGTVNAAGTTFINASVCDDPGNRLRWGATIVNI